MRSKACQFLLKHCTLAILLWAVAATTGCASRRGSQAGQMLPARLEDAPRFARAEITLQTLFPSAFRATQRAIITVRKRQYVCDGYLTVSRAEGWHLAVVSPLGLITDVRVQADGATEVLRITPLFPVEWSRAYVARDLRWLFAPPSRLRPAGRLADGRLMLEGTNGTGDVQAYYLCNASGNRWEELELRQDGGRTCRVRLGGHRSFPGCAQEIPTEINLESRTHQLHLRTVALSLLPSPATEAP